MTQTAWAHLPNAKHIDWVIASVKAHPKKWVAARDAAWAAAYDAAYDAAYTAAWNAAELAAWRMAGKVLYDAAWTAVGDAVGDAAREAAKCALLALVAYDDCAYMVESDIDEIKILAKLGDQRAILLLPACIVFNETKVKICPNLLV